MCFLGIDVGTTGTKSIVVDPQGKILGKGYFEYALITGDNNEVEQNAEDWWTGVVASVKAACAEAGSKSSEITAISMSTQGGTTVPVDKKFKPICNAITWMDGRAEAEKEKFAANLGEDHIYKKTGWQPGAYFDPPKLSWMEKNKHEIFDSAAYFITTIEYVNFKLTGNIVTDPSNAAMRQLFNINTGSWDAELTFAAGIETSKLPEIMPTGTLIGNLTETAAKELGLSIDVKVFNGAHDQYCASIGSGAVNSGDMLLSTGTTWVVLGISENPIFTDTYLAPGIHPCKGKFGNIASLRSAGSALKWLKQVIGSDFKEMDEKAAGRMTSAKDIYFYPYLAGAGFPHNDLDIRSTILGLEIKHDKYDITRALMESVAFETRMVLEEFSKHGADISHLKMVGGAAKSVLWSQITCNVTGCGIQLPSEADTCCIGAAMIAATGSGEFKDFAEAEKNMVNCKKSLSPDKEAKQFYDEKYRKYKEKHSLLKTLY